LSRSFGTNLAERIAHSAKRSKKTPAQQTP
jgi:hypothetical protein